MAQSNITAIQEAVNNARNNPSMLEGWFELNRNVPSNDFVRTLLYSEIPYYFVLKIISGFEDKEDRVKSFQD